MSAVYGYEPTPDAVSFESWPIKVEAIDYQAGAIMLKANSRWFSATEIAEQDRLLLREINRTATVEALMQGAVNG